MKIRNIFYKLPFIRGILNRMDQSEREIRELRNALRKLDKQYAEAQKEIKRLENEAVKNKEESAVLRELIFSNKREQEEENQGIHDKLSLSLNAAQVDSKIKYKEWEIKKYVDYRFFQGLNEKEYPRALSEWYYEWSGKKLDLDHPATYNEKIQWIKLFDNTEQKTRLADKYAVREWVKEKVGEEYLIPLLGVWDCFEEIEFDKLPKSFVLKANHGCGYNYIVRDKSTLDYEDAKYKFKKWMSENFAYHSLELQYKHIPHKIIAEEYVENGEGELDDYKIFCFNGKAKYIMFLAERQIQLKMAFYDLDWNLLPFTYSYPQYTKEVERPKKLDEMIRVAEKLAEGFNQVRVDLYYLKDDVIKFGEMTFTSASGGCKWDPPEYDEILGELIELPIK